MARVKTNTEPAGQKTQRPKSIKDIDQSTNNSLNSAPAPETTSFMQTKYILRVVNNEQGKQHPEF